MYRSMFCSEDLKKTEHSRWVHPLQEQRTLLFHRMENENIISDTSGYSSVHVETDNYRVIGQKESGCGFSKSVVIMKRECPNTFATNLQM